MGVNTIKIQEHTIEYIESDQQAVLLTAAFTHLLYQFVGQFLAVSACVGGYWVYKKIRAKVQQNKAKLQRAKKQVSEQNPEYKE